MPSSVAESGDHEPVGGEHVRHRHRLEADHLLVEGVQMIGAGAHREG
jgi:hypothetical protein